MSCCLVHEITTLTFFSVNAKCVIRCEFLHFKHYNLVSSVDHFHGLPHFWNHLKFENPLVWTRHNTRIHVFIIWLKLGKPNNKGTLKLHLSARICFSALPEDRRVTVYQRANWFFFWLSAVNEDQQYNACDIFHLPERQECYFVRQSMKELWFSDQSASQFPLPHHLLKHS